MYVFHRQIDADNDGIKVIDFLVYKISTPVPRSASCFCSCDLLFMLFHFCDFLIEVYLSDLCDFLVSFCDSCDSHILFCDDIFVNVFGMELIFKIFRYRFDDRRATDLW